MSNFASGANAGIDDLSNACRLSLSSNLGREIGFIKRRTDARTDLDNQIARSDAELIL